MTSLSEPAEPANWITPSGHTVRIVPHFSPEFMHDLISIAPGQHQGCVVRSESMTELDAERRNSKMSGTVIEWRKAVQS